jgi:hypothetical protein
MLIAKSFDSTLVSPTIELPRIEEMLVGFPFVKTASMDDLYKNGNSDLRNLLSKVPLKNKHKYVTVNMEVQLLFPGRTTAPRSNWHFDGMSFEKEYETECHLLVSDCEARTEFLAKDIHMEQFTDRSPITEVEIFLNRNLHLVESKMMPPNAFVTFNEPHFHRPVRAIQTEFRFMIRVLEANNVQPRIYHESLMHQNPIFDDKRYDYSDIDHRYILENRSDVFVSIQRPDPKTIVFNYMDGGK